MTSAFAAALGDLDTVRGYFAADGRLRADIAVPARIGARGPPLGPQRPSSTP